MDVKSFVPAGASHESQQLGESCSAGGPQRHKVVPGRAWLDLNQGDPSAGDLLGLEGSQCTRGHACQQVGRQVCVGVAVDRRSGGETKGVTITRWLTRRACASASCAESSAFGARSSAAHSAPCFNTILSVVIASGRRVFRCCNAPARLGKGTKRRATGTMSSGGALGLPLRVPSSAADQGSTVNRLL
jgi:hypothetical protein